MIRETSGPAMKRWVDIVFDGPPSHESGRFVEVEDSEGKSIRFGEWVHREDGYWVLRIPDAQAAIKAEREACAVLAEHFLHGMIGDLALIKAIRARGDKP